MTTPANDAVEAAERFFGETEIFSESLPATAVDVATAALAALLESVRAEGERMGRDDERARIIEVVGGAYGKRAQQIARVITRVSEDARQMAPRFAADARTKREKE